MPKQLTLFVTNRGERHQQAARDAVPDVLDVVLRRTPIKDEIIGLLPDMDFLISERTGTIDADIIAARKKLKLIQRLGLQTWDIDTSTVKRAGVPVCFMPVRSARAGRPQSRQQSHPHATSPPARWRRAARSASPTSPS